jgi:hypothetical protein
VALSDTDGWHELLVPVDNLGAASLSRTPRGTARALPVEVRKSGAYLTELGLSPVRLLKLDIEGHEEQFLAGGLDFLRRRPPDAIVFESNEDVKPLWRRPTIQVLADLDYELVEIARTVTSMFRMQLRHLARGQEPAQSLDFVAIHRTCYPSVATRLGVSPRNR